MIARAALATLVLASGAALAQPSTGVSISYNLSDLDTPDPVDSNFSALFTGLLGPFEFNSTTINLLSFFEGQPDRIQDVIVAKTDFDDGNGGKGTEYTLDATKAQASLTLGNTGGNSVTLSNFGEVVLSIIDDTDDGAGGIADVVIMSGTIAEQTLIDAGLSPQPGDNLEFRFSIETSSDLLQAGPDDTVPIPDATSLAPYGAGFIFINSTSFNYTYAAGNQSGDYQFLPIPGPAPIATLALAGLALTRRRAR